MSTVIVTGAHGLVGSESVADQRRQQIPLSLPGLGNHFTLRDTIEQLFGEEHCAHEERGDLRLMLLSCFVGPPLFAPAT